VPGAGQVHTCKLTAAGGCQLFQEESVPAPSLPNMASYVSEP
jgi:hypothetical protein